MLCEKCRIREATIQYTEVVNGKRTVHSYCTQCAKESDFGAVSALFEGEFPFAKILSALFGGEEGQTQDGSYAQVVCPSCGSSYQDFVENSRFGCADCYELFDLLIRDSIKSLQGSETHKGKRPKYGLKMVPESLTETLPGDRSGGTKAESGEGGTGQAKDPQDEAAESGASVVSRIRELRFALSRAVREEAYEEAARLRDEIRRLEQEAEQTGRDSTDAGEEVQPDA